MRFTDFLKTSVLLSGGASTALAVVTIGGANANDDRPLLFIAAGWWALAAAAGLWLGRRPEPAGGVARMIASARTTSALPELEPGTILVNRLWPIGALTILAGALAFLIPQVPAAAAGYGLIWALGWRKQAAAVTAVEDRDGVRFYVERTSPFTPTRLLRTPWLRKDETVLEEAREGAPT